MRGSGLYFIKGRLRLFALAATFIASGIVLSGCASSGDSAGPVAIADTTGASAAAAPSDTSSDPARKVASAVFGNKASPTGGSSLSSSDYPSDYFLKQGYCPPARVNAGTEALTTYERGHDGDAAFIRTQASIDKLARECRNVNGTLTLKIGVAGRVVAGPKGGADKMLLPLRIAVVKQAASKVLFSKLYKVPVSLAAPDFASDFSEVAENVTVQVAPDDHDLIILVGFDAGNKKR